MIQAGAHPRCTYPYAENWDVPEGQIARLYLHLVRAQQNELFGVKKDIPIPLYNNVIGAACLVMMRSYGDNRFLYFRGCCPGFLPGRSIRLRACLDMGFP